MRARYKESSIEYCSIVFCGQKLGQTIYFAHQVEKTTYSSVFELLFLAADPKDVKLDIFKMSSHHGNFS